MRVLLVCVLLVLLGGCAPEAPAFSAVDLPAGARPVLLAGYGGDVLIGVRRDGHPVVPGVLRANEDGAVSEIPVRGESPYGLLAKWYAIDSDGDRILAVGGERGGAHANVRWSVWTGTAAGITEKVQGFSTFGGWGAGELVGAALASSTPVLVGSWQSAKAGLDVAVWTAEGDTWARRDSAGTELESDRRTLAFANSVTAYGKGALIGGMRLTDGREIAMVWQSAASGTGWTGTPLPDAGKLAVVSSVRCWGAVCGAAGSVDGTLALWRMADGVWKRLPGTPPIPVKDSDKLAPPLDEHVTQVVSDNGQVKIVRADGDTWTANPISGPSGTVTSAVRAGDRIYVLAGDKVWRG
ncbi:hypothetical protein [Kibdelosporangium phytohabitans]|uniref:Uncharacterized protein n=1 Tax=Kibdelosporangium phytohabitans TaxID=860235 RepID=A0A0N9HZF8_9PSEU|nr:hypothetical protein [Kibdelosporangium phytohabitans]ALG08765.1 hypothetical protein AOZ06_19240 [Kibdelosporangium phytohabitans]MBE1470111.1 hypothetical protein [Kibdelosporangium phytohabitans]